MLFVKLNHLVVSVRPSRLLLKLKYVDTLAEKIMELGNLFIAGMLINQFFNQLPFNKIVAFYSFCILAISYFMAYYISNNYSNEYRKHD